jgi:Sec-independent protein secretion pathway component TatC
MSNMRTRISTLWIVVMCNMIFADILGMMIPGVLTAMSAGQVGVPVTQGLVLAFAIVLEVPIAMIFLSRILKPRPNRWANTVAAVITTAFVIAGGSPYLHYYFFETVQIACLALIVWSVWTRRASRAEQAPNGASQTGSTELSPSRGIAARSSTN